MNGYASTAGDQSHQYNQWSIACVAFWVVAPGMTKGAAKQHKEERKGGGRKGYKDEIMKENDIVA